MNVISYLHAKASKLYVALAIIAGIGILIPSTASSQAPGINCIPVSWYQNYNGAPDAITNVTLGSLNNTTPSVGTPNNDFTGLGLPEPTIVATITSTMIV